MVILKKPGDPNVYIYFGLSDNAFRAIERFRVYSRIKLGDVSIVVDSISSTIRVKIQDGWAVSEILPVYSIRIPMTEDAYGYNAARALVISFEGTLTTLIWTFPKKKEHGSLSGLGLWGVF